MVDGISKYPSSVVAIPGMTHIYSGATPKRKLIDDGQNSRVWRKIMQPCIVDKNIEKVWKKRDGMDLIPKLGTVPGSTLGTAPPT